MRIAWLDALRGVTMFLVILHHILLDLSTLPPPQGLEPLFRAIRAMDSVLAIVRMPAFFLVSGILFSQVMGRGWRWFATERLWFMAWVVFVWTLIYFTMIEAGFNLLPLARLSDGAPWWSFYWSPYSHLWFLYAIGLLGFLAMALRGLPPGLRLALVYAVCTVTMLWAGLTAEGPGRVELFQSLPVGLKKLFSNVVARGAFFFFLGVVLGPRLIRARFADLRLFGLSCVVLAICGILMWLLWLSQSRFEVLVRFHLSVPATFAFLYASIFLLGVFPRLLRLCAGFGRISLDVFLLHQIPSAALFAVFTGLGLAGDRGLYAALSIVLVVPGSVLLAKFLRHSGFVGLFAAPRLPPEAKRPLQPS